MIFRIMEPADCPLKILPSDLIAKFNHFITLKLTNTNVAKQKEDLVFKCLSTVDKRGTEITAQLPPYSTEEVFWKVVDFSNAPVGCLSWRNFRLLVTHHFIEYISENIHFSRHISFHPKIKGLVRHYLEDQSLDLTNLWNGLLMKMRPVNQHSKERTLFQACKRNRSPTVAENMIITGIQEILRNYTVENVIDLAVAVFPPLKVSVDLHGKEPNRNKDGIENIANSCILYHVLNTHINWISHSRHHIINTGLTAKVQPRAHLELRCTNCHRLLTTRKAYRGGNLRNTGVEYSIDTHEFSSLCCHQPVFGLPLVVDGTVLSIHIQGDQMYHVDPNDSDKLIHFTGSDGKDGQEPDNE